ncbi:MAG: hypothetical protein A4E71_02860 [Smithella sp. PtaU1.Bin162]|nr:MAG: hypothetical protein A4E71_02860 [Smithella sp. PtaU1.Bin162]
MPRGNGTGPMGMGPMTGRAAGFCAGFNVPGYQNNAPGQFYGRGFRRGDGFGRRNRFYATGVPGKAWFGGYNAQPATPETEKIALQKQAEYLQAEIDAIKKRLDELTTKD